VICSARAPLKNQSQQQILGFGNVEIGPLLSAEGAELALHRLHHRPAEIIAPRHAGSVTDGFPKTQAGRSALAQFGICPSHESIGGVFVPDEVFSGVHPPLIIHCDENLPAVALLASSVEPAHQRVVISRLLALTGIGLAVEAQESIKSQIV